MLSTYYHLQLFYFSLKFDLPYLTLTFQLTGCRLGKEEYTLRQFQMTILVDDNITTLKVSYYHLSKY